MSTRDTGAVEPAAFDIPTTAKYLGISRSLAYELARSGRLPAIRLGRRWLVPRTALEAMLAEANNGFRL